MFLPLFVGGQNVTIENATNFYVADRDWIAAYKRSTSAEGIVDPPVAYVRALHTSNPMTIVAMTKGWKWLMASLFPMLCPMPKPRGAANRCCVTSSRRTTQHIHYHWDRQNEIGDHPGN